MPVRFLGDLFRRAVLGEKPSRPIDVRPPRRIGIPIERAIQIAREAVPKETFNVIGGMTLEVKDIISASHASARGRPEDTWTVIFELDWGGQTVEPDVMLVHVHSETQKAEIHPIL